MLLSRISNSALEEPTPEDILQDSLSALFSDDQQTSHGGIGNYLTYHSPRFGDIEIKVPSNPYDEGGRRLFAHYLWNAAIIAADQIEEASYGEEGNTKDKCWDVRGKTLIELGAGG